MINVFYLCKKCFDKIEADIPVFCTKPLLSKCDLCDNKAEYFGDKTEYTIKKINEIKDIATSGNV